MHTAVAPLLSQSQHLRRTNGVVRHQPTQHIFRATRPVHSRPTKKQQHYTEQEEEEEGSDYHDHHPHHHLQPPPIGVQLQNMLELQEKQIELLVNVLERQHAQEMQLQNLHTQVETLIELSKQHRAPETQSVTAAPGFSAKQPHEKINELLTSLQSSQHIVSVETGHLIRTLYPVGSRAIRAAYGNYARPRPNTPPVEEGTISTTAAGVVWQKVADGWKKLDPGSTSPQSTTSSDSAAVEAGHDAFETATTDSTARMPHPPSQPSSSPSQDFDADHDSVPPPTQRTRGPVVFDPHKIPHVAFEIPEVDLRM